MCRVSQSEGSRPAFQAGPIYMSVECASAHTSEGEYEPENLRGWKTLKYCRYCPNAHLGVFFLGLTSWQVQSIQLFKKHIHSNRMTMLCKMVQIPTGTGFMAKIFGFGHNIQTLQQWCAKIGTCYKNSSRTRYMLNS